MLVPLCGASLDLAWLAERGVDVTGIELSPIAARRAFEAYGKTPERTEHTTGGARWETFRAGRLTIHCGDIFDASAELVEEPDAVWDRAALIAIDPAHRDRYVAKVRSIAPRAELLLSTLTYASERLDGPPYSVEPHFVRHAFDAVDVLAEAPTPKTLDDGSVVARTERTYRGRIRA